MSHVWLMGCCDEGAEVGEGLVWVGGCCEVAAVVRDI